MSNVEVARIEGRIQGLKDAIDAIKVIHIDGTDLHAMGKSAGVNMAHIVVLSVLSHALLDAIEAAS